ncbi:hypothetical protein C8D88_105399 [Lentzea atacamensis]|uniref:Uncharacterized protein n=1 Tax=Lentzea atacamensis TaxID=531938 RepID=A0A316I083_9PSEU|nr:hypothetical protein [Lentzea atacamensis]PWK86356.1 hypothetical protein C8D88_105399 [Lentzea atacamensis]
MRKFRTTIHALIGSIVVIGGLAVVTPAAQAITIPVACSENALVAAVNLANSTATADTLVLVSGCTYGLTPPHGGLANTDTLPAQHRPQRSPEARSPATRRCCAAAAFTTVSEAH